MLPTESSKPAVAGPLPHAQSLSRRIGFAFLCAVPFLNQVVLGVRAFHVDGIYQTAGAAYFAVIVWAMWTVGARGFCKGDAPVQRLALAGILLLVPMSLMALLWVGIGAPWEATAEENRMRFLVLAVGSISLTSGFVVLQQALRDEGEGVFSSLALAFALLAGTSHLTWFSFHLQTGPGSSSIQSMSDGLDALEFFACTLTYAAAFLFTLSLGRAGWIRRRANVGLALASAVGFTMILLRGISYRDLEATTTPGYVRLASMAGVPAITWIIPILLGVLVLGRAGRELLRSGSGAH